MLGVQAQKGIAATPTITIPYISESFSPEQTISNLRYAQDDDHVSSDDDGYVKTAQQEAWSFITYLRADNFARLMGYFLGVDAVTTTGGKYTHTLTRNERKWLTIERKLDTGEIHRLFDAKIESVTIGGTSRGMFNVNLSGGALNAVIRTTEQTPSYPTVSPFHFNDVSLFKINTTSNNFLTGIDYNLNIDSGGGIIGDEILKIDFPDFNYNGNATYNLYSTSIEFLKDVYYDSGNGPDEDVQNISTYIKIEKDNDLIEMTIPQYQYQSLGGYNLNSEPSTLSINTAGIMQKQNTTELVQISVTNDISTSVV